MVEIFDAFEEGKVELIRSFVDGGGDVNVRDHRFIVGNGHSLLHLAAAFGNVEIAKWLIDSGADADAQDLNGWTPLIRACNEGNYDMAKLLLEAGADPNLRNKEGYSPWGRIMASDPALMELLESYGGR